MLRHEYAELDPSTTEALSDETDPKKDIYKWVDNSSLYIHIYEGKYNNVLLKSNGLVTPLLFSSLYL